MTKKITLPLTFLALLAGGIFALPADAMAAVATQAEGVAGYWQEIAIGIAGIAGAIILDTSSWSLMTSK
ncbi:MAG: hypothetical protein AAF557_07755 [Pseudomonadota bacterium]